MVENDRNRKGSMSKIKVGQIGIGHNHGQGKMLAFRKFPELFEIIGYSEESQDWIEQRGNLPCYADLPRLTEEEIIAQSDLVVVETDIWNLTATAQKCIDAGKHVHLDKPASGTLAEFERLLNTAKEKGLVVQMGYMYRYNYAIKECMRMIKSGELGDIYQIDTEMSTNHSDEYRAWLQHFKGGTMYIFGSHLIDLIVTALGEPKNVVSFVKQTGYHDVYSDDNVTAILEYERAVAKVTTCSVELNGWGMRKFTVMGSLGTVEIKPIEVEVRMTKAMRGVCTNAYADRKERVEVSDVPHGSRYDEMVKDLYLAVTGQKENPYGYEHELTVQKVLYQVTGEQ